MPKSTSGSSRSSSRSGSSSENEETSRKVQNLTDTSREVTPGPSHVRQGSATNTIDGTSIADTTTVRSASPTTSHASATGTGSVYDATSIATSNKTGATTNTQQSQAAGGIPIIRPPGLQQQPSTDTGVVGPQRPTGYPTQPPIVPANAASQKPIQIDVAAAQQQYQQRGVQPEISPYSGSTTSSSTGSLSSPGSASIQQQQQPSRYNAGQATVNQANSNRGNPLNPGEFRQQTQTGVNPASGPQIHQQQQQAQFANQIPAHEVYNELLGPDAFKDVILDIDYGALGGFNAAFQSGGDFSGGQLPPGISIRPAYTTVDSLSYQQHMFNTARTIHAGSEQNNYDFSGMNNNYNISGTGGAYDTSGGQQFDVAKALFNQADANKDGSISQAEFRQWAQAGQQNYGGQSYAPAATTNFSNNTESFYHASLFDGANPAVANILQQSGLGQVVPN